MALGASCPRTVVRRSLLCAFLASGLSGLHSPAASAHVSPGAIATSFRASVGGFRPPAAGVSASVKDGDQKLQLTVASGTTVIVFGIVGEPFLRFGAVGVYAASRSPTAANDGLVTADEAAGPARWILLTHEHTYSWHENRLRPLLHPRHPGDVATWRVPLLVDGRRTTLVGTESYARPPRRSPWLLLALAPVAAALVAGVALRRRLRLAVGVALAVIAATAWTAGWIGVLLYQRTSPAWIAVSAGYAISVALLTGVALAEPANDRGRLLVIGTVGVLALTFSLPELGVFERGFLFSDLPAPVARGCVALAIGAGFGAALLAALTVRAGPAHQDEHSA